MPSIEVVLAEEIVPPDSDIVFTISFDATSGSAAHVFDLAADLIRSLQGIDDVLIQSIDAKIETMLVLEDLQKSSVRVFLRTVLAKVDDDALKSLDWKQQVGRYLVKGKYAAIRWLDGEAPNKGEHQMSDLTEEIARLAQESDVRHLPDYPRPNPTRFAQALDRLQETKAKFGENEELTITLGKDQYRVDLSQTWLPSDFSTATEDEKKLSNEQDMYLIIKKPDFLGTAQWQFKHGKTIINATIEHDDWMDRFKSGDFPLRPGDALHVRMRLDYTYNPKGDLIDTKMRIVHVFEVRQAPPGTPDLFKE